jgi:hypothetical protein
LERQLAQSIAEDFWRLNRVPALENNMFALGHTNERSEVRIALADARTFQTQADQFSLLTIYEQRINRNVQRNLKLLRDLIKERKAERKARHDEAIEEAKILTQGTLTNAATAATPLPVNKNGFEFSNAEIGRDNILKAASLAAITPQYLPANRENPVAAAA